MNTSNLFIYFVAFREQACRNTGRFDGENCLINQTTARWLCYFEKCSGDDTFLQKTAITGS